MRRLMTFAVSFAVVLGAGVAVAAVAPQFGYEQPVEDKTFDAVHTGVFGDPVEHEEPAPDEPVKDQPVKDEPVKDQPVKDEPVKDEPVKDEPVDQPPTDEDVTPPELVILSPDDGAVVETEMLTFRGETEPGARVFAGDWEAEVTDGGAWAITLKLRPGGNVATFTAKDAAGNVASARVSVTYEAPDRDILFSAHQKFGQSYEPYEIFWGTARPGALVVIESRFGSARTEAGPKGNWDAKVWFEGAPVGEPFRIVVESDTGRAEFTFTLKGERDHRFTAHQAKEENPDGWNVYWGTGHPGAVVDIRSEYGHAETKVRENGEWEVEVRFEAPTNTPFRVVASSGDASATFTFTIPARQYDFTAHQKYGSCGEELPYDVFYGTGKPGTVVEVESAYGSGRTEIGDGGQWELRVEFPGAPVGETFIVTVWNEGGSAEFRFIVTEK